MNLCETIQNSLKFLSSVLLRPNSHIRDSNDKTIKRIIFPSFANPFMSLKYTDKEFIKFLYSLRTLIRSSHCTLLMTVPNDLSIYLRNNLRHCFDFVVKLEPKIGSLTTTSPHLTTYTAGSKEFEDFNGFFKVIKAASLNSFLTYSLDTDLYGFKASKKRVLISSLTTHSHCTQQFDIEKLYLNPEPDITFEDVNKSAAPKKEGPLLCTSKPGGTNQALEF